MKFCHALKFPNKTIIARECYNYLTSEFAFVLLKREFMDRTIILLQRDKDYEDYLYNVLVDEGYKIIKANSAIEILHKLDDIHPDLIILSYELPSMDGESFYKEVNKVYDDIPFIFISAQKDVDLIATMLNARNCDFMVKPVVTAELLARIKYWLTPRNTDITNDVDILKANDLELNISSKQVKKKNKDIVLTPTEYKLLEYLLYNKNKVLSREAILNKVWGTASDVSDRIVDVYVGYLREKIDNKSSTSTIETVSGFGYCIRD
jgi:DNA-binding response OmpR family regulator